MSNTYSRQAEHIHVSKVWQQEGDLQMALYGEWWTSCQQGMQPCGTCPTSRTGSLLELADQQGLLLPHHSCPHSHLRVATNKWQRALHETAVLGNSVLQ